MNRYFICKTGISLVERMKREAVALISIESMVSRLGDDPLVSAESNTLSRLNLQEGDFIRFFTSPDELAVLQAEALSEHYRRMGQLTGVTVLAKHGPNDARHLYSLVIAAMRLISQCDTLRYTPEIIVTSGFKHEVSFLALLGLIERVPVRYMLEGAGELFTYPPMPVKWNFDLIEEHELFFSSVVAEEVDRFALESMLHREPALTAYFKIDPQTQKAMLSELGFVLHFAWTERYLRQLNLNANTLIEKAPCEDQVTNLVPDLNRYTLRLVAALSRLVFVGGVYPDTDNTDSAQPTTARYEIRDEGKTDALRVAFRAEDESQFDIMQDFVKALI